MTVARRFRDMFAEYTPWWLSDRPGKNVGYRFLWSMIDPLDVAAEVTLQGLRARFAGVGTSSALAAIGASRGIIRGQGESDESYAARLLTWLEQWRTAGSALAIARAIHTYCANHPRVRIITRSGYWVTLDEDGTITRTNASWNWDGVSHPERAGNWSDIWVIVYPSPWAKRAPWGSGTWGSGKGHGQDLTRQEYDAIRGELNQWKSAHTKIVSVVWTSNSALFDPADDTTKPDGTWGNYGGTGASRTYRRRVSDCRYWDNP